MIEKYKDDFLDKLGKAAITYKLIGTSESESPMWFQYSGLKDGSLLFTSSQRHGIWFAVKLKDEDIEDVTFYRYNLIYEYFRNLKYEYLREFHPSVYNQIKSTHEQL